MEEIPAPLVTDSEDVTTALETALVLWKRHERGDAVAWVRRAARAAGEASDDDRAVWLARIAAELADQIAGKPKSDDELVIELEVEPPSRPSSADDVVTSAPPHALLSRPLAPAGHGPPPPRKPPPPPPRRPPTVAPPAKPASIPPPGKPASIPPPGTPAASLSAPTRPASMPPPGTPAASMPPPRPATVAPPRPPPPKPAAPPRPLPPPRPPIPTVDPDPMEETVTEWPPRELSDPAMALPPVAPSTDEPVAEPPPRAALPSVPEPMVPIEPTVTEWPPVAGGGARAPSEPPTRPHAGSAIGSGGFPTEAPTVARAPRASDLRPSSSVPSPPARGTVPPPAKGTVPPPGKLSKTREPSAPVPIQIEGDILDEGEAPPTFRPPEPSRRQPTIVPKPELHEGPVSEGPRSSEPEPQTRRMPVSPQLVAATAPPSAGPAVDLGEVPELSDLPDDAREKFAAKGSRRTLRAGETLEGFALALVLRGEADLVSPEGALVVERLRRGAVLRARGSEGPSQHVALVGALAGTEVICWDEASVDEALGACPWVESELRSAADRRLCELGAMRGALGARLDPDLRQQLFEAVQVKVLSPGETLTHEGETVPALAVVGTGVVELCKGGAVERQAGAGEILYGADVLRGARAPLQTRAGSQGALVLLADKSRRAALFANFPSLLEILADM